MPNIYSKFWQTESKYLTDLKIGDMVQLLLNLYTKYQIILPSGRTGSREIFDWNFFNLCIQKFNHSPVKQEVHVAAQLT